MSAYPQPVVGAFILNPQNQILLVHSFKWAKGKIWSVPGGRIEIGETINEAVIREVKEEVGLKIKLISHFATFDAIFPKDFYKKSHFIFLECLCRTIGSLQPQIDHLEIQAASWFSLNHALKLRLEPFTRKSLNLLKNHKT